MFATVKAVNFIFEGAGVNQPEKVDNHCASGYCLTMNVNTGFSKVSIIYLLVFLVRMGKN